MVANIAITLVTLTGVLKLADFILTDKHKKHLSDAVLKLWYWIDELKQWSMPAWLKSFRTQRIIIMGIGALAIALALDELSKNVDDLFQLFVVGALIIAFPFAIWIGPHLSAEMDRNVLPARRVPLLGTISGITLGTFFIGLVLPSTFQDGLLKEIIRRACEVISMVGFALSFIASMGQLPRYLGYLLGFILKCAELIVRRIAEYPNGPLLAIVALCALVIELIKTYSSQTQ